MGDSSEASAPSRAVCSDTASGVAVRLMAWCGELGSCKDSVRGGWAAVEGGGGGSVPANTKEEVRQRSTALKLCRTVQLQYLHWKTLFKLLHPPQPSCCPLGPERSSPPLQGKPVKKSLVVSCSCSARAMASTRGPIVSSSAADLLAHTSRQGRPGVATAAAASSVKTEAADEMPLPPVNTRAISSMTHTKCVE